MIKYIGLIKLYITRGYSLISIPCSIFNFTLIFYALFLKHLSFVPEDIKHFKLIIPIFFFLILMLCLIIGYFDYKKGTYKIEEEKIMQISSNHKLLHYKLDKILEKLK